MTPLPDPFGPLSAAFAAFEGPAQADRVRRGMWILATTPRPPVGQTPHAVIHSQGSLRLRYTAPARDEGLHPVVMVPSLINKAWILDLEPDRSLVAALSQAGHPVYVVDWGTPGPEDAQEDVGYVLLELLHRCVRRASRHAGGRKVALFGYCMGGTLAAMYAALRPGLVAGLVALNAPVRFAQAGRFAELVQPGCVDINAALGDDGLVPVSVMKPAFQLLDPVGNWSKHLGIEAASGDPRRLARVLARERWLEENVPVSGAFAREFIHKAYQQDALLDGSWTIRGEAVRLEEVTAPALVVCCQRDFIAPPASTRPLAEALGGAVELVEPDVGHIGIVVGSMGPKLLYPLMDRWLRGLLT